MEDIKAEVRTSEFKRESLRKSLEEVKAQASSILLFTLQWKELENHFDSVQDQIEKRIVATEMREKQLEAMELELKLKEEDFHYVSSMLERCSSDLNSKKVEFGYLQKLVTESREELEEKKGELGLLKEQIGKYNEEIAGKMEKLDSLKLLVEENEGKLKSWKRELELVTKKVDQSRNEVCLKTGELEQLQRSINEKSIELKVKEMDLELKANKMNEYDEAIGLKKKELEFMQNSIDECSQQLDLKQAELVKRQQEMEEHSEELYEKRKYLKSVKSLIREFNEELEAKEKKHQELEKSVLDHADKLKDKEKELEFIEGKIKNRSEEFQSKNAEIESLQSLTKTSKKKVESTKEELNSVKERLKRYSEDLELREQEFNSMQLTIEECRNELYFKEKQLSSAKIRIQESSKQIETAGEKLKSIKNSISECTKELESKEEQTEAIKESHKRLSKELESKEKQLGLMEKRFNERLEEANVKEKHLDARQRSLEECSKKLETEKRQFDALVKELELKEKELEEKEKRLSNARHSQVSSGNSSSSFSQRPEITNAETVNLIMPSQVKTERPEPVMISNANEIPSAAIEVCARRDGKSSQCISNYDFDELDLRQNEVLEALQMSLDPARFVLNLMLETCSQHQEKGGTGFEESVLKIYVLMLEQLLRVSPLVEPDVTLDALKFAMEWKMKMNLSAENSVEVLGFLQFVAAFGLATHFSRDEILELLLTVVQNRQAQHIQAQTVCKVLGLTDKIPDFVSSLIASKRYIEAVKFTCAFGFEHKFSPELILNQFWNDINGVARNGCRVGNNSREVLAKAADEQIAALRSVIQCIKDCKLEIPVEVIESSIAELEKEKMKKNQFNSISVRSPSPAVQLKVQGRTNCNISPSVPRNQPSASTSQNQLPELSNKRARTKGLAIRSYTPQVLTHINPYVRSSSHHGLGVPVNQVANQSGLASNLVHSSNLLLWELNAAQELYFAQNRSKQL